MPVASAVSCWAGAGSMVLPVWARTEATKTASVPQSTLQVVGIYIQFPTITGAAPPDTDCDSPAEAGRVVVRTDGPTNLYLCTGSIWVVK
jgi:hypothetical protein